MGIRFFCPKGHKLNVKEFLAGKKAICPYCGMKVLVPLTSTRTSSKHPKGDLDPEETAVQVGPTAPLTNLSTTAIHTQSPLIPSSESSIIVAGSAGVIKSTPILPLNVSEIQSPTKDEDEVIAEATPEATNDPQSSISSFLDHLGNASGVFPSAPERNVAPISMSAILGGSSVLGSPAPKTTPSVINIDDPLIDAKKVKWYIRQSSGDQLGPATNDTMRHWIAKGRVKADSLVWQEGWPEWQPAENVFPEFGKVTAMPAAATPATTSAPAAASSSPFDSIPLQSPAAGSESAIDSQSSGSISTSSPDLKELLSEEPLAKHSEEDVEHLPVNAHLHTIHKAAIFVVTGVVALLIGVLIYALITSL
jgi:hypothetical protein